MFCGITWTKEYFEKDFTLQLWYRIDGGDESEMFEITRTKDQLDPEHPDQIHFIDLQEYGMKAELIAAGSNVEIKVLCPTENQFAYIHAGYREYY